MGVEWRSIHRQIARTARPCGAAAAVTETRLVADQHLAGAEGVPVGASRRGMGDPLPGSGLHQIAQHDHRLSDA